VDRRVAMVEVAAFRPSSLKTTGVFCFRELNTGSLGSGSMGSKMKVEWFDDLKLGMRFESEGVTVSKDDIIRFASEYDPQPFHLDEEAAKKTILGGLAASGWHTAAIAMRLASSCRPFGPHPLFGAGVDDLRWLKPVRPGDTIHLEGELVELVPSRTKPHGVARIKWTAYNQHGEAVYTFNPIAIVPSRPGKPPQ
jgi:acyl dehydratase